MSENHGDKPVEGGDVPFEGGDVGVSAQRFTETIAEAKAKIDGAAKVETAESLNVDAASFDKYFDGKVFDWASYGKEQAFKAAQKKPAEGDADPAPEGTPEPVTVTPETEAAASDAVSKAGLDWDELGQQIVDTGDISAESREALGKIGIPETLVDQYLGLLHKDATDIVVDIVDGFGGEEKFGDVFDALQEKATAEQRDAIDEMLKEPSTFDLAIQTAFTLAEIERPEAPKAEPGVTPEVITPNASTGGTGNTQGYESFAEQVNAIKDPRYKTDPAYRAEVMNKVRVSTFDMNPRAHSGGL
jgi:hypothetical protein